jgi:hypothetical protein
MKRRVFIEITGIVATGSIFSKKLLPCQKCLKMPGYS